MQHTRTAGAAELAGLPTGVRETPTTRPALQTGMQPGSLLLQEEAALPTCRTMPLMLPRASDGKPPPDEASWHEHRGGPKTAVATVLAHPAARGGTDVRLPPGTKPSRRQGKAHEHSCEVPNHRIRRQFGEALHEEDRNP